MKFKEFPENIRVKISAEDERRLWNSIGNMTDFSERNNYSRKDLYNWKHHTQFLPAGLVAEVLESPDILALKGRGRSKPVENPVLPLEPDYELLTRIEASVAVNRDGVPVYQTDDRGLASRFIELLQNYGKVPVSVYNRSMFEIRYPKYLHRLFSRMDYEQDFGAIVDEKGDIENGYVKQGARKIPVEKFEEELYSRSKRLSLALARGESQEVARIISKESRDIEDALNLV